MKKFLKASVLAVTLVAGTATPALAFHGPQEEFTAFYNNESHDIQVGYTLVYCDGHFSRGGTPTLYSETTYYSCD